LPTYEYACNACGHQLEAVQSFTDDALTDCPECGGALRKVYGAVGIVLKGSGFYKNDSRAASGNGTSAKKGSESSNGDSSTSESATKESTSEKSGSSDKSSADKGSSSKDSTPAASTAT
jgi:putative FmdB family regulatory protein